MVATAELMVKYGFVQTKDGKPVKDAKGNILADEEKFEMNKTQLVPTGFPKPLCHYRLIWESPNVSMEHVYFWITTSMRNDASYTDIIKISDVFAASQSSSFFGASQARLGVTQDRAASYFAQIGKLVKDLFQMVREIRVLKQKLEYYDNSMKDDPKLAHAAEIVLKGIWIDQVEGGTKNPASVYGMSREVGFVTLPDLFFSTHPRKKDQVKGVVDKLEFNRKVKEVLTRKLYAYLDWKEKTYEELKQREKFTIKFLKQHYEVIKLYMDWVKPYLKYAKLLSMHPERMEGPELVSAFEGSLLEVEVLGKVKKGATHNAVLIAQFIYRTTPTMPYHQDEYRHKGPLHVGKVEFHLRAYAWTDAQVESYVKMRQEEDFQLLASINDSIKAAMDALGKDLVQYLTEAEEGKKEEQEAEKKKKPKTPGAMDPFTSIVMGFAELGSAFFPKYEKEKKQKKAPGVHPLVKNASSSDAGTHAKGTAWAIYKNFKKAHKLLSW